MLKRLRIRLTLLNSAVVLAILLCILSFVYIMVQTDSVQYTDSELMSDAYMLKRYVTLFEKDASAANAELNEEYLSYKQRLNASNISYGIWDINGTAYVYVSSYQMPQSVLDNIRESIFSKNTMAVSVSSESDGKYFIHVYNFDGMYIRVCTTVIANDFGQMRILQTVQNMNLQESMADRLLNSLVLSVALGVLLSVFTGYFIAGRSIKPIQKSMQQQKEFVADASHELRTPVTVMRTNLDVVKACADETVASQMDWVDNAYRETEHMEALITNLLQIAKSDVDKDSMNMQHIFVQGLCTDAIERFAPVTEKKHISLRFFNEAPQLVINADYQKLMQVLSIVMDNAIKYSSEGGIIELRLKYTNKYAIIELEDSGIGIEKDELNNIFERFYRTDKARSRKEGGTGLGLAIAKQITEAHNGTISADSEKGKGTTITITLPVA